VEKLGPLPKRPAPPPPLRNYDDEDEDSDEPEEAPTSPLLQNGFRMGADRPIVTSYTNPLLSTADVSISLSGGQDKSSEPAMDFNRGVSVEGTAF
jgi:hypothetical protein